MHTIWRLILIRRGWTSQTTERNGSIMERPTFKNGWSRDIDIVEIMPRNNIYEFSWNISFLWLDPQKKLHSFDLSHTVIYQLLLLFMSCSASIICYASPIIIYSRKQYICFLWPLCKFVTSPTTLWRIVFRCQWSGVEQNKRGALQYIYLHFHAQEKREFRTQGDYSMWLKTIYNERYVWHGKNNLLFVNNW